jgi:hypothetical protein
MPWTEVAVDTIGLWKIEVQGQDLEFNLHWYCHRLNGVDLAGQCDDKPCYNEVQKLLAGLLAILVLCDVFRIMGLTLVLPLSKCYKLMESKMLLQHYKIHKPSCLWMHASDGWQHPLYPTSCTSSTKHTTSTRYYGYSLATASCATHAAIHQTLHIFFLVH